jgi:uncharacterized repeat protein (TIGR03803 family)
MTRRRSWFFLIWFFVVCFAMVALVGVTHASAQTEAVIHSFQSGSKADGAAPFSGVVADSRGALYGVTSAGGKYGAGAAFKLTPPATQGGEWKQDILFSFGLSNAGPARPAA